MYDLVIIGAGAAGLSAAIYAARAGLDFTVLEQDGWGGGQITSAHTVENYPGCPNINGGDLAEAIKKQAVELGAEIKFAIVNEVADRGDHKEVMINNSEPIKAKAVIVATGAVPRKIGAEGEQRFIGRGVSYCAVCDGAFFAGKRTVVVGGGDTAVEDAIYLSSICSEVVLVHRREGFRAAASRVERLKSLPNVTLRLNETVEEIKGENLVSEVVLRSVLNGGLTVLKADGIFAAVGTEPETALLQNLGVELKNGYVIADETCATNVPGIFAAGDVRQKPMRQVITAAADGANAVNSVLNYLLENIN